MNTITAVIPAKNEEKNIKRCVESVKWCNKIIIMWMGEDKTAEIARKIGANVVEMNKNKNDDFVAVQKNINWAIDHCKTDWMLRLDADEVVTSELKEEIKSIIVSSANSQDPVAYGVPRKQYFIDGFLKGGDWAYDRLIRLFRPKFCRYDPLVSIHEQFKVKGKTSILKNALLHYSHPTIEDLLKKFDTYTTAEAKDLKENKLTAFGKMLFLPPYIFLRWMIWHKGWIDGTRGVKAAYFRAYYDFLLYSKYLRGS